MYTKIGKIIKGNWLIIGVLVFAAVLRLWELGSIPPGLTPDEASLGYNTYSILKTGRDEHGQLLPIIFKFFGDYRPGLYVYLSVPFVALLGLSEFTVRLPSAIAGVVAVVLIYLIVQQLFQNNRTENGKYSEKQDSTLRGKMAILAAAMLAISPWHIHFSRGVWEANVSLTLTLAGILLFLKAFKKPSFGYFSLIFFALTFLVYQGAMFSTPIIICVLAISYNKSFRQRFSLRKASLLRFFVFGVLIMLPVGLIIFPNNIEKTMHLNNFYEILRQWFAFFSARFLFFEGDWQDQIYSIPNHGMMLLADLLLLPLGLYVLIKDKLSKEKLFIILWLILAPLPAILLSDQNWTVRSYNTVIPLVLISSFGFLYLLKVISKIKRPVLLVTYYLVLFTFMTGASIYFLDAYFIHLPKHNAKYWFYGYKQVVEAVGSIQNNYDKIVFQQSDDQPYIYFLFYQKYDPKKFQEQSDLVRSEEGGVSYVQKLDNIHFQKFSWPYATGEKRTLLVGSPVAVSADYSKNSYNLVSEIKYPDNFMTAFRLVETK